MYQELINHSPDLIQIKDEGYELEIKNGYALVHHSPYVNANGVIRLGSLVSSLTLAGNRTVRPDTHVIHFIGEHPCDKNGNKITGIQHNTGDQRLAADIIINHSFSNKPPEGYNNYYEKFLRYIEIIAAPANSMDSSVTARTYRELTTTEDYVFNYYDTNSCRANIGVVNEKLRHHKIGIIGLGGTGAYILDLVAKTPVAEIHLFDRDTFLQHNAFRAPGAPSILELQEKKYKTDYFQGIYEKMRKNIFSHPEFINLENIQKILSMDFIFICIDEGKIKKEIIDILVEERIPFIDVGMGVHVVDDSLLGIARITTAISQKSEHLSKRISFADGDKEDEYSSNIQIADLNALNATLAVIKWKKLLGFYQDFTKEFNTAYILNTGEILNEDKEF